jgi:HEAT repeat protein
MDEVRLGTIQALATIGTPESKAILEGGRNSKDESLRDACSRALKGISTRESTV